MRGWECDSMGLAVPNCNSLPVPPLAPAYFHLSWQALLKGHWHQPVLSDHCPLVSPWWPCSVSQGITKKKMRKSNLMGRFSACRIKTKSKRLLSPLCRHSLSLACPPLAHLDLGQARAIWEMVFLLTSQNPTKQTMPLGHFTRRQSIYHRNWPWPSGQCPRGRGVRPTPWFPGLHYRLSPDGGGVCPISSSHSALFLSRNSKQTPNSRCLESDEDQQQELSSVPNGSQTIKLIPPIETPGEMNSF